MLLIYFLYMLSFRMFSGGVGLLPPEHVYLKSTLTDSQRRESRATTIYIPVQGTTSKLLQESGKTEGHTASRESILREVTSSEFLNAVNLLSASPVAYLPFLPRFGSAQQDSEMLMNISQDRFIVPMERCWALTLH